MTLFLQHLDSFSRAPQQLVAFEDAVLRVIEARVFPQ
jgi:hypothetical protein